MVNSRYKRVVDRLSEAIHSGVLPAGSRLPTHRQLAKQEKISLVTATRVYSELKAQGLISGEVGRGTFVRELSLPVSLGIEQPLSPDKIDLNFNYIAQPLQTELLRSSLKKIATSGDLESLLRYQSHSGTLAARRLFTDYVRRQGITQAKPEQMLIVSGAQHGLSVMTMGLLKPGDVVAVDELTYPGFKALAQSFHLELAAVSAGQAGPDLAAFEQLCRERRIKAYYTMPTLHNPLGWVMSLEQRLALIEIARRYDVLLFEDATYAFLVEQAPAPLAALAPDMTVYISGFSKNIATGLRVGFIIAPLDKKEQLERIIRVTTWNTSALLVTLVCDWLESDEVTKMEQEKRIDAAERQRIAQTVFAGMRFIGYPVSYYLWLKLPDEVRCEQVVKHLSEQGIAIATAQPFAVGTHIPHAIRLALGAVAKKELEGALIKVRQAIEYYIDY